MAAPDAVSPRTLAPAVKSSSAVKDVPPCRSTGYSCPDYTNRFSGVISPHEVLTGSCKNSDGSGREAPVTGQIVRADKL